MVDRTDEGMCAGTPLLLEREFARIASSQSLELSESMTITVELGEAAVADRCESVLESGVLGGCVMTANGEIGVATSASAAPHELVHAARHSAGVFQNHFFEEGIAEALRGGEQVGYSIGDNATTDPLSPTDAIGTFETRVDDYITAGHFVSWMRSEYGDGDVFAALASTSYVDAATATEVEVWFESAFAESLASAELRWRDDGLSTFWQPGPCATPVAFVAGLEISGTLDCDSEDTIGTSAGGPAALPTCVAFDEPTDLVLEVAGNEAVEVTLIPLRADGGLGVYSRLAGGDMVNLSVADPWLLIGVRTRSAEPEPYSVRFGS